ncbi:MAG: hypothetical protein V5A23_04975 [Halobacteriales archaeon]
MADGFPGGGRVSQPTILVSGRPRKPLRRVPLRLFGERARPGDGVVIATTRDDPAFVVRRLTDGVDAFSRDRIAMVDCTTKQRSSARRTGDRRWEIPSPVAFGDATQAVDEAIAFLRNADVERVHFLFDTLTTQFRLADADDVLKHTHDLAMTVGSESGLGVFTVEHAVATGRESERLKHFFDVHVEVRRSGDATEVRWAGLVGRSDGWVALADSGIRFDALGQGLG